MGGAGGAMHPEMVENRALLRYHGSRNHRMKKQDAIKKGGGSYLVLSLHEDTSEKELKFEIDGMLAMSVEDRYRAAIELSLMLVEMMERHGHREPHTVLQRAAR
jgi:hypothetical protein